MTFIDSFSQWAEAYVAQQIKSATDPLNAENSNLNAQVVAVSAQLSDTLTLLDNSRAEVASLKKQLADCQAGSTTTTAFGTSLPGDLADLKTARDAGLKSFRVFYPNGLPKSRQADPVTAAAQPGETWIVSMKQLGTTQEMTDYAKSWTGIDFIGVYFHEPEDNIPGVISLDTFRKNFKAASDAFRAGGGKAGLVLMRWTLASASGRNWLDYFVDGAVDFLIFDAYNSGRKKGFYADANDILQPCADAAKSKGVAWGIGETGTSDLGTVNGVTKLSWTIAMHNEAVRLGAKVACWWNQKSNDGGTIDYTLDARGLQAWSTGK